MTELFPYRLRELRERKRMSRRTLGELCGLSKNTIARYERGERMPTIEAAALIADFFNVSLGYLCGTERTEQKNLNETPNRGNFV